MDKITIGYLSWKRHSLFEQTLNSHKVNGLFDIIKPENRLIFFQEISQTDINIAKKYNCKYIGDSSNIGILNGFIKLVENCNTEYFVFSENDWLLIENNEITCNILEDCINILQTNKCDIIRLRHSKNPGMPLHSRPSNVDDWIKQNISGFPYKLESLSWIDEPNKIYNNIFTEFNGNYKWYITNLNHQKWSNNIFISNTSYLKNVILPLINNFINNNDKYLGLEEILVNYNSYLGKNNELDNIIKIYSKTRLAGGNGLFTHKDNLL
jgi:hypothetical protein